MEIRRGGRRDRVAFVGRHVELERLERALARVKSGEYVPALVTGEPGIGKTSLLAELSRGAGSAGFEVVAGSGSYLETTVPFGLIVDALDERLGRLGPELLRAVGEQRVAELGAFLPSLAGGIVGATSPLDVERYELHRAVQAALEQLSRERPLLLVLDDLHWADPASAEVVSYLLRHGVPGALLVLSYRSRQLGEELAKAVAAVEQTRPLRPIELGPLTAEEAAESLGRDVDSPGMSALYVESGGNPFYLEQLARFRHDESELILPPIEAGDPSGADVPVPVSTAINQELAELSPNALLLLQAGAVAGDRFDLELAVEIAGQGDEGAQDALKELLAANLLRAGASAGRQAFRHPIVRRAVYRETAPSWRLFAHERAVEALARRGASIGVRAHHVERSAGVGDEQAIAVLEAAGHAAAARAPAAAARWFEAAEALLPPSADPGRRMRLLVPLAGALATVGRLHESRARLVQALGLLPPGMSTERGRLTGGLARMEQGLGRGDEARLLLEEALTQAGPGTGLAVWLKIWLAENDLMAGAWDDALARVRDARREARLVDDRGLYLAATAYTAYVAQYCGEITEAQECIDETTAGIEQLSDGELAPYLGSLVSLAYSELTMERWRAAIGYAERGLRLCRETGQGYLFLGFMVGLVAARMFEGSLAEARRSADSASEAALLLKNDQALALSESLRCWVARLQGDVRAAVAAGDAAMDAARRAPGGQFAWLPALCYGELLIELGERERGRDHLLRAGGHELEEVPPSVRSLFFRALAELEAEDGRAEAAAAMAERAEAAAAFGMEMTEGEARYARACVGLSRGEPSAAAKLARDAVESFSAAGTRLHEARARVLAGRCLAAAGKAVAARSQLEIAHQTFVECGAARMADRAAKELRGLGRRMPRTRRAFHAAGEAPSALTEREREVADLVADGYTNREIADRLYVSVKTVETHLHRVFDKLGVSSRGAVTSAIERRSDHDSPPGRPS